MLGPAGATSKAIRGTSGDDVSPFGGNAAGAQSVSPMALSDGGSNEDSDTTTGHANGLKWRIGWQACPCIWALAMEDVLRVCAS
mmetsp:Transcript_40300/g.110970  ORF Transcript_40300/g.110970 Transcript_40300/m.110970 type:complete len:84 (-) Transcript_40300:669-920(-)